MKKLLLILLLAFSFGVNAQYYTITYIQVPYGDQAEVARLETKYWSQVAKANIDSGKQLAWGLFARPYGNSDQWTHAFVNVYQTLEQLTDNSIWNTEEILGISAEDIQTFGYYTGSGINVWKIEDQIPGEGKATIWNFAKPDNLAMFIDSNKKIWKKQFEKDMGGRTSWGIAKKLTTVSQNNSSVMTWDSYPSLADALDALDYPLEGYNAPKGDKTSEANPDGWIAQVVVQQVMWITATQ